MDPVVVKDSTLPALGTPGLLGLGRVIEAFPDGFMYDEVVAEP